MVHKLRQSARLRLCLAFATLFIAFLAVEVRGQLPGPQPPPNVVYFSDIKYTANESGLVAHIRVNAAIMLGGPTPITVQYSTSPGTAQPGINYYDKSGTLDFTGCSASCTAGFDVELIDDGLPGPPLTVILTLSNPTNCNLGNPSTATLTIVDDDQICDSPPP